MVCRKQIDFSLYNQLEKPKELGFVATLAVTILQRLKLSDTAYKLECYHKIINFLRVIGLYILSENPQLLSIETRGEEPTDSRMRESLMDFLFHFGIIAKEHGKIALSRTYDGSLKNIIIEVVNGKNNVDCTTFTAFEKKLVADFRFITDLVKKYNQPDYQFKFIAGRAAPVWSRLISERKLDYEVRLCETLVNLKDLRLPQKIQSPFTDDYYTESGQNAFKNFTKDRFTEYLKHFEKDENQFSVFDLGCGYGNYIDAVLQVYQSAEVTGIEQNETVFAVTQKKFQSAETVIIVNDDFFQYSANTRYDMVLMNYVLFYFDYVGKKAVLEKAKQMLKPEGAIVLCQYFSGIELLKKDIAVLQGNYSLAKQIEMFYSDKILYANTLWNDTVDAFTESVKWDEFKTMVAEAGLTINRMVPADPFYYSFFVELKTRK